MAARHSTRRAIVLVVEDEPLLRMAAVAFIEEAGYAVVEATNADEAIDILEARTDIHIVFTDIDMPGSMNGLKLAAAVRGRWPPLEVIITSGHRRFDMAGLPERGIFIPKPYDGAEVVAAIDAMAA